MINYETIIDYYYKEKSLLDERYDKICEDRVIEITTLLTLSGIDANDYTISMGTEYIGEWGSKWYKLYCWVTETVFVRYSEISGNWTVRNKVYSEVIKSIRDNNTDNEEEDKLPEITEEQFLWILEFRELSQFMQYKLGK